MTKRGQKTKLKNTDTGQVIEAKVILSDSKQGYLAELIHNSSKSFLDAWHWYNLNEWSEIK